MNISYQWSMQNSCYQDFQIETIFLSIHRKTIITWFSFLSDTKTRILHSKCSINGIFQWVMSLRLAHILFAKIVRFTKTHWNAEKIKDSVIETSQSTQITQWKTFSEQRSQSRNPTEISTFSRKKKTPDLIRPLVAHARRECARSAYKTAARGRL